MLNRFKEHLELDLKISREDKILLAVSGGVDSMVMAHLFLRAGMDVCIAHVNHNTRDGASDKDAAFVHNYADSVGVPFYTKKLDKIESGNFQSIAHSLRYEFFESLGPFTIATGHHEDDNVETILMNFLSGRSISGISPHQGNRIRPLLIFSREEIESYAEEYEITYVEDASNRSHKYFRNFLRLEVLPSLEQYDPHIGQKIQALSDRQERIDNYLHTVSSDILIAEVSCGIVSYNKNEILSVDDPLILFYGLRDYGINYEQSLDIIQNIDSVGNHYFTETHEILIDRNKILIRPLIDVMEVSHEVRLDDLPRTISFKNKTIEFTQVNAVAPSVLDDETYVPMELLDEVIIVRSWKDGDSFQPYGMGGQTQKLKKFFVENKVNRFIKERIPIFLNGEEIFWVGGYRTDERYKWDRSSRPYLRIKIEEATVS